MDASALVNSLLCLDWPAFPLLDGAVMLASRADGDRLRLHSNRDGGRWVRVVDRDGDEITLEISDAADRPTTITAEVVG